MAADKPLIMALHGRLGNQLFSFATGLACARRADAALRFYDIQHIGAAAYPLGDLIGERLELASPRELARVGLYDWPTPLRRTLSSVTYTLAERRAERASHPRLMVQQRLGSPFRTHANVFDVEPPVMLVGYFQSEDYFADHAEEIDAAIRLPEPDHGFLRRLPRPVVSVTLRRGDYADFGWMLPLAFYANALEYCLSELSPASLLVFSDDPEFAELAGPWMRERSGIPVFLGTAITRDPLQQLAMIAACDHHIVANSTFCWWGAWLGERRSPAPSTVIAPAGWVDGDDGIIPARWVAIGTNQDDDRKPDVGGSESASALT
jgi:hypothetical protein